MVESVREDREMKPVIRTEKREHARQLSKRAQAKRAIGPGPGLAIESHHSSDGLRMHGQWPRHDTEQGRSGPSFASETTETGSRAGEEGREEEREQRLWKRARLGKKPASEEV